MRVEANRVESHGIYILLGKQRTKALRKSHEPMHDNVYFPAFGLPGLNVPRKLRTMIRIASFQDRNGCVALSFASCATRSWKESCQNKHRKSCVST